LVAVAGSALVNSTNLGSPFAVAVSPFAAVDSALTSDDRAAVVVAEAVVAAGASAAALALALELGDSLIIVASRDSILLDMRSITNTSLSISLPEIVVEAEVEADGVVEAGAADRVDNAAPVDSVEAAAAVTFFVPIDSTNSGAFAALVDVEVVASAVVAATFSPISAVATVFLVPIDSTNSGALASLVDAVVEVEAGASVSFFSFKVSDVKKARTQEER
jgi:hypothetical protein